MEYVYSALLLHSTKQDITAANIKKVLMSAGVQPDEAKIKALIASMEGVDIEEAVKRAAVAVAAPAAAAGGEKKGEEDEEEEEKKAEEAAAGLGALFG